MWALPHTLTYLLNDKLWQITGNLRILDVVSSQSRKYIYSLMLAGLLIGIVDPEYRTGVPRGLKRQWSCATKCRYTTLESRDPSGLDNTHKALSACVCTCGEICGLRPCVLYSNSTAAHSLHHWLANRTSNFRCPHKSLGNMNQGVSNYQAALSMWTLSKPGSEQFAKTVFLPASLLLYEKKTLTCADTWHGSLYPGRQLGQKLFVHTQIYIRLDARHQGELVKVFLSPQRPHQVHQTGELNVQASKPVCCMCWLSILQLTLQEYRSSAAAQTAWTNCKDTASWPATALQVP